MAEVEEIEPILLTDEIVENTFYKGKTLVRMPSP
jgi:hypothetical protein